MQALYYAVKANGSFALPDVCLKIRELITDESSTASDFANVISIDPSMTYRLLKIANSSIYKFPGEISTITRAITIVGINSLYEMMLTDVAATAFRHFSTESINLKRFWRYSIYSGLASKNLAIAAGIKDVERFFVAGLLSNFGELIVASVSPEIAIKCEKSDSQIMPWDVQKEELGFCYTDVSAELLKIWQIPEQIIIPIKHFNKASEIQLNNDVKVLHLASCLALADSYPNRYTFADIIDRSMCSKLGLSIEHLEQAARFAYQEASNVMDVMGA